jgi:glycosyltransferase involved in cell wall biosynthesis
MCVSEGLKRNLETKGIAGAKISVLPMGVDETFVSSSRKRRAASGSREVTVLSNRKFLPVYNIPLLIRAIPWVIGAEPGVRFVIAGDGPERERLERQANELKMGSSIRFLGWVRHEEMADLLLNAEIYVSTSLEDGTSVSLLEAMASGAFPIVTDIPSNREWIKDGENGFLIPVQDERKLADRIIEAIRNPELMEKTRDRNREMIKERAYWERNVRKVVEIYGHILTGA